MNSVDLSEVLLDEMVILDREPFKDKDDMFNVMTRQFETAGLVSDAGAFKKLWIFGRLWGRLTWAI